MRGKHDEVSYPVVSPWTAEDTFVEWRAVGRRNYGSRSMLVVLATSILLQHVQAREYSAVVGIHDGLEIGNAIECQVATYTHTCWQQSRTIPHLRQQ